MLSERRAHYLRALGETTVPRCHLVLDVETGRDRPGPYHHQGWRLACAAAFTGYAGRGWSEPERLFYRTPLDLWSDVHARLRPKQRLVIWCHNLSFDLRASEALPWLMAMGHTLEGLALDAGAAWARFSSDHGGLVMVDSHSWLPAPLALIRRDLGREPVELPDDHDDELAWRRRCEDDVEVTRLAVMQCLELVEDYDLGPWRPTGAGQSHSAWRRRWLTHRPLVHDRLHVLDLERQAAWTGRCEAWRWGELPAGQWTEFDLRLAYCQIAADSHLPCVLVGPAETRDLGTLLRLCDRHCVLARVRVRTEVPILPAGDDEGMLWPVGEFETVVWDPELRLAAQYANQVEVLDAWVYRSAPLLADASRWLISALDAGAAGFTPVQRRMLKHWARAMVGRCALRYRNWEDWGECDPDDLSLGMMDFRSEGVIREALNYGGRTRVLADQEEAPDSLPQIPSWVMSECRRRLWGLMVTAGGGSLAYVDTDSLIVDRAGAARLEARSGELASIPATVKGRYSHVVIHGPRMLEVDGGRRMAGVPLQARRDKDGRLSGEVFVSLRESMLHRNLSSVAVQTRTYEPAGLDRRRVHLPDGQTSPIRWDSEHPADSRRLASTVGLAGPALGHGLA